jgi:hypothetical protein
MKAWIMTVLVLTAACAWGHQRGNYYTLESHDLTGLGEPWSMNYYTQTQDSLAPSPTIGESFGPLVRGCIVGVESDSTAKPGCGMPGCDVIHYGMTYHWEIRQRIYVGIVAKKDTAWYGPFDSQPSVGDYWEVDPADVGRRQK